MTDDQPTAAPRMSHLAYLLRHGIPLFLVQLLGDLLPDYGPAMRLRGRMVAPFLGSCGRRLEVGRDVTIHRADQLSVGDDVYFAKGSWLMCDGGLVVDDDVMFGPYVVVSTATHVFRNGTARRAGWRLGEVRIGRGTWIAAHATVTRGVEIGPGCLVGANSVVTRDVAAGQVVSGVPAVVSGAVTDQDPDIMGHVPR